MYYVRSFNDQGIIEWMEKRKSLRAIHKIIMDCGVDPKSPRIKKWVPPGSTDIFIDIH